MTLSEEYQLLPEQSAPRRAGLPAAVLFDMDGLLLDTEPVWFEVETQMMAEYRAPWGPADHAVLVGSALPVSSAFLAERIGGEVTAEHIAAELLSRMAIELKTPHPLRPGAAALIDAVDAAGIPRALVSSTFRSLIDAALAGIAPISFDVIVAGDDVSHNKPHPEPYLMAAARLGVDPRWCVALEDSPSGAASANAAGCHVIAVPSVTGIEPATRRTVINSLEDISLNDVRSLFG